MKIKLTRVVEKTLDLGNALFKSKEDKNKFIKELEEQGWKVEKIMGEKQNENKK